jgi:hypothetical protein
MGSGKVEHSLQAIRLGHPLEIFLGHLESVSKLQFELSDGVAFPQLGRSDGQS